MLNPHFLKHPFFGSVSPLWQILVFFLLFKLLREVQLFVIYIQTFSTTVYEYYFG